MDLAGFHITQPASSKVIESSTAHRDFGGHRRAAIAGVDLHDVISVDGTQTLTCLALAVGTPTPAPNI